MSIIVQSELTGQSSGVPERQSIRLIPDCCCGTIDRLHNIDWQDHPQRHTVNEGWPVEVQRAQREQTGETGNLQEFEVI